MSDYFLENNPYAAQWLRNLISAKHLKGEVDERSIVDVSPDDLRGFVHCHFFAGIGGWALAAKLAGWPDDRELWTGSPPCQPFSVAGKQLGTLDERHLWPHQFRLIDARRPARFGGEQVAAAIGQGWLDGVFADLEGIGYACRAVVVPACAVNSPHRRDRLWLLADAHGEGLEGRELLRQRGEEWAAGASGVAHADVACASEERPERSGELGGAGGDSRARSGDMADADRDGPCEGHDDQAARLGDSAPAKVRPGAWDGADWISGHDGKARRVEPGIRLLAHGVPARVGKLRAYGNAIVPQVAAEVLSAWMECRP